ncbi:MAG TPA: hypothetical protein VHN14_14215 [Kofleriaceae bacterium]|nr:hypothetical protein [Kofleriaceae bacterium]
MNKLLSAVGLAMVFATASLLAGCQLYFGDHSNGGSGPKGTGSSGPGNPPGFSCNGDAQCAAGCFCADGVCTEGGFCGNDKDCGTGFHCDTTRSSCIPNPQCTTNAQCMPGSMCDTSTGGCMATCTCTGDADAVKKGFGWCDEARGTCMTGSDPAGTCTGTVTCTTPAPTCPDGQVPLRKDGCFTGQCRAIAVCEAAPACNALQHQGDCVNRATDCTTVFTGHNCHGTTCGISNVDCTCDSYTFSACEDKITSSATRIEFGQ